MKIATYGWGGRRQVGQLTPAGDEVVPLAVERAQDVGALALIELMAANKPLPGTAGMRLPLSAVEFEAPLPQPRRISSASGATTACMHRNSPARFFAATRGRSASGR